MPSCIVKAYMLYGPDSKQVLDLVAGHREKKFLRNLLSALQEVEEGTRPAGKGQGRGPNFRKVRRGWCPSPERMDVFSGRLMPSVRPRRDGSSGHGNSEKRVPTGGWFACIHTRSSE